MLHAALLRPSAAAALATLVVACLATGAAGAGEAGPVPPPDRYIVVLDPRAGEPQTLAAHHGRRYAAAVTAVFRHALSGYAAAIPADRLAALRDDPAVRFLSPDREVHALEQSVGTGVDRINAEMRANRGAGVGVAVLDTGIDVAHPDLAASVAGGVNCSNGGPRSYGDGHGHGTHVAGIVAALDNGVGVRGVAPAARLWSVRVLNDRGTGPTSDVVCGLDYVDSLSPARGGPISVANMSLGGLGADDGDCGRTNGDALHLAVCRTVADGVTVVVAAGNSSADVRTTTPAAYDEVVTVTALADSDGAACAFGASTSWGADDTFASFSNYASSPADQAHTIAAPGVGILSTYRGGGYATVSGTSMASPHVAGAAALYLAAHPGASPAAVREALRALGEPKDVNVNGECGTTPKRQTARVSHRDPSLRHPEPVVRADSL